MKKLGTFAIVMCIITLASAQNCMNFHFNNGKKESINITDIDTIHFPIGEINVTGKERRNYTITSIDSATFTLKGNQSMEAKNFSDTVNGVIIDMVYVEGGTYIRGCDNCAEVDKKYESPSHQVTVSDFYIAKYEVTNELYNAVMGTTSNFWEKKKAPKIGVNWFGANEFICKL
ncbi:MAG: SUMF1/EgtB/PvdO family nonheme iron enzyme, partial [Paludibacteraceae bacterium]|nr:SUMF1/EgtB/PvdO family nonheme iron enzyme [Paludibacteraceae bacterium]